MTPLVLLTTAWLGWMAQNVIGDAEPSVEALLDQLGAESRERIEACLGGVPDAEQAKILARLAQLLAREGDDAAAESLWREVLRQRGALLGEAHPGSLFAAAQLAGSLGRLGRLDESIEVARRALEASAAGTVDARAQVSTLHNALGVSLHYQGDLLGAEMHAQTALAMLAEVEGPDSEGAAVALHNIANLQRSRLQLDAARTSIEAALAIRRSLHGPSSRPVARSQVLMGSIALDQGLFEEAERELRAAEVILRPLGRPALRELEQSQRMLGYLLAKRGDWRGAEGAFREACELSDAVYGPDSLISCAGRLPLCEALASLGEGAAAETMATEALECLVRHVGENDEQTLQAVVALARCKARRGALEEAKLELRAAAQQLEQDPVAIPSIAPNVRAVLAELLSTEGRWNEALAELEQAEDRLLRHFGPDHYQLVFVRADKAVALESLGDYAGALAAGDLAFAAARSTSGEVLGTELERSLLGGALRVEDTSRLVARLRLRAGDIPGAFLALEQGREPSLVRALHDAQRARQRDEPTLQDPELTRALDLEERLRGELRDLESRATAGGPAPPAEELARASRRLGAASAEVHRLLSEESVGSMAATLEEVRGELGTGQCLLAYLWSTRQVSLLVVPGAGEGDPRSVSLASQPEQVSALEARLKTLADALASDPREASRATPDVTILAELLPPAAREALASASKLVIVPDGPLHALPLGLALETLEPAARPTRAAVLVPSASAWLALSRSAASPSASPDRPGPDSQGAVVLGDPSFGAEIASLGRTPGTLARLPATRVEAEYAAELLRESAWEVTLLLGESANRSALEQASANARWIHLATHGLPGTAGAPLAAALVLSRETGTDSHASLLGVDRMLRRWKGKLAHCEAVVLSACDTHRQVLSGTGSYSLALGFFQAGAPRVLASLWRADDHATALLMGRFYENRLGRFEGQRTALGNAWPSGSAMPIGPALEEARAWLRTADRSAIRQASRRMGLDALAQGLRAGAKPIEAALGAEELVPYADPFFWAGFVLIGRE